MNSDNLRPLAKSAERDLEAIKAIERKTRREKPDGPKKTEQRGQG